MKRNIFPFSVLFYSFVALNSFGLDSAELGRITLANQTPFKLLHVFVSPEDSGEWGADILSSAEGKFRQLLHADDELNFYIHFQPASPLFDLFAIDEDHDSYLLRGLRAKDNLFVAIGPEHYQSDLHAPELIELILTNASAQDLWFIFLNPANFDAWGVDLLTDEGLLEVGDSMSILLAIREGNYDFLGLTETGDIYYKSLVLGGTELSGSLISAKLIGNKTFKAMTDLRRNRV